MTHNEKTTAWLKASKKAGKLNTSAILSIDSLYTKARVYEAWKNRPSRAKKMTYKQFADLFDLYKIFVESCREIRGEKNIRYFRARVRVENAHENYRSFFNAPIYPRHDRINASGLSIDYMRGKKTEIIRDFLTSNLELNNSGSRWITIHTGNPYFSANTSKGDQYSRSCTYRKTDLSVTISVAKNYLSLIRSGLAIIDDLVNLACIRVTRPDLDLQLYAAAWLEKSRGFDYNLVHGFIAVSQGWSYHGSTEKKAINGLYRKIKKYTGSTPDETDRLLSRAEKSNKYLTVAMSIDAGNCETGTINFCHKYNINPDHPLPIQRAVILYKTTKNQDLLSVIQHAMRGE